MNSVSHSFGRQILLLLMVLRDPNSSTEALLVYLKETISEKVVLQTKSNEDY